MNTERNCIYEIETEVSDLNEKSVLKPYAYQKIYAQIVEQHLNAHDANVGATMKYGLAWALVSMSFEIAKPVLGCVKLYAQTWYSHRKGPFFRREILVKNGNDEEVFKGSSFSVLLDIEKRTIYRGKEIPFLRFEPAEELTIDANPTFKPDLDFHKVDERKVYNSHIDCLGHVNNSRYGEFAYDALTNEERDNLLNLKRMSIYFLSELRNENGFSVLKAGEGKFVCIRGYNQTKDCVSFDVVFDFH